ncbi:spermidine synthase [Anatilimnocola floriformis]|uniref:spermidine synthase n=1 Tax=Anatilimnocola floriformis TaxID=2948575 RepID=UPI0020C214A6|nr:fused MFS/spermidine synthase [Anatilimnocola floriformis]
MNTISPNLTTRAVQRESTGVIVGFATTIFLSAFLLFQVQPMLSKVLLPWFGGSPAVWTAAMLFFQLVLLGGYYYAHFLSTHCTNNQRLVIHLSVLALAAINVGWNRLTPPQFLRPTSGADDPLLQTLLLLGVTVGLPYFALSSTGPLLQKWFHDVLPGSSPYRLFALSNFGSLVALLSYPFFFEIRWGVTGQAWYWSLAYMVFVGCCALCAVGSWRARREMAEAKKDAGPRAEIDVSAAAPPSWQQLGYWLGLSTLASIMFLAVTNEVCQNVAPVPLLWVVPLSLYLCSFIVAFDHSRWYSRWGFGFGVLVLLALVVNYEPTLERFDSLLNRLLGRVGDDKIALVELWSLAAACYFFALFLIATLCHGELARSRPAPEHLTKFYLTMSLGGAAGGLFVNLAAPYLFDTFFEFPLGIVITTVTASGLLFAAGTQLASHSIRRYCNVAVIAIASIPLVSVALQQIERENPKYRTLHESRNFYGVVTVMHRAIGDPKGDENYTFFSGNIQHGKQLADPARRKIPLTYYGEGSGCETAVKLVQSRSPECHIGVVGLGVGTIAAYAREKDTLRFYEINPEVIRIAQDERWFHFLSDCPQRPEVVLGDARLQLELELKKSGSQEFDVLVIDAFSGDAVPTHLLTREAFDVYLQHLKPGGVLAMHITNTHLDLYPVVTQLAKNAQCAQRRIYKPGNSEKLLQRSYYFLVARDEQTLASVTDEISELPDYLRRPRQVPMWTDDYTNLTSLLR